MENTEIVKKMFSVGSKVRCIKMDDPRPILSGEEGVVESVDDAGQIHINWNNGRYLALIPDVDEFELVSTLKLNSCPLCGHELYFHRCQHRNKYGKLIVEQYFMHEDGANCILDDICMPFVVGAGDAKPEADYFGEKWNTSLKWLPISDKKQKGKNYET